MNHLPTLTGGAKTLLIHPPKCLRNNPHCEAVLKGNENLKKMMAWFIKVE